MSSFPPPSPSQSDVGKFAGAFDPLAQILYQYAPWLLGVMGGLEKVLLKASCRAQLSKSGSPEQHWEGTEVRASRRATRAKATPCICPSLRHRLSWRCGS